MKALDAALNALEEARAHLEARAARRRSRSARAGAHRGAAVRAARRRPQIQCRRSTSLPRWPQKYAADLALIDAGAEQLAALEKPRREGRGATIAAAAAALSAGAQARPATQLDKAVNGELTPLKLERANSRREIDSDAAAAGPERHRPRRVLGADQSRHAAGAADEGRLRRRARALPAGAEGRAGRSRLGADAGLRRDRHRRRRRGGRRDRRAAGAARRRACRCSPSRMRRRSRRAPSRHYLISQGRAGQGQAGRDPRHRGRRRRAAARRSPACWPAPRSPTKRAPRPSG